MAPSTDPSAAPTAHEQLARWAASGAMWLTGRPDGPPLGPPARLVPGLDALADRLAAATAQLGTRVDVDPLALLVRRAAHLGLQRDGTTSCGGATRLLPAGDGWVAASLARPDDLDLLPAWLDVDPAEDPWPAVAAAIERRPAAEVVDRGRLLGLPVATLPPERAPRPSEVVQVTATGSAAGPRPLDGAVVVDLTSLWAGPLCGSLLALAGAEVVKVESHRRPDGARLGPRAFFEELHAGKRGVVLDLPEPTAVDQLRDLLAGADVVLEGSRPRALQQLGIDAHEVLATGRPRVWCSITAHGRVGDAAMWVGFGDDAAVAGGLVARDGEGPVFCADAVADPVTGLTAAGAVAEALLGPDRVLLDVALSRSAAALAGPTLPVPEGIEAAPPPRALAKEHPHPRACDTQSPMP